MSEQGLLPLVLIIELDLSLFYHCQHFFTIIHFLILLLLAHATSYDTRGLTTLLLILICRNIDWICQVGTIFCVILSLLSFIGRPIRRFDQRWGSHIRYSLMAAWPELHLVVGLWVFLLFLVLFFWLILFYDQLWCSSNIHVTLFELIFLSILYQLTVSSIATKFGSLEKIGLWLKSLSLIRWLILSLRSNVLDKINAIDLALLVNHVVALELVYCAVLFHCFESVNTSLKLPILDILCVPVRNLMELKQVSKLHLDHKFPFTQKWNYI